LSEFEVSLRPIQERVASGEYDGESISNALDKDLRCARDKVMKSYNEKTSGYPFEAVKSQRADLERSVASDLRRLCMLGAESEMENDLSDQVDRMLYEHSTKRPKDSEKKASDNDNVAFLSSGKPVPKLWLAAGAVWRSAAEEAAVRVAKLVARAGVEASNAELNEDQACELKSVARMKVLREMKRAAATSTLPEAIRRAFDEYCSRYRPVY